MYALVRHSCVQGQFCYVGIAVERPATARPPRAPSPFGCEAVLPAAASLDGFVQKALAQSVANSVGARRASQLLKKYGY